MTVIAYYLRYIFLSLIVGNSYVSEAFPFRSTDDGEAQKKSQVITTKYDKLIY